MWEADEFAPSHSPALGDAVARLAERLRGVAVGVMVAAVVIPLVGCDSGPNGWFRKGYEALCPRPQTNYTAAAGFNQQQQEIRSLRQRAFRGDFFSQLELARRYEGGRAADRNLEDPVEAAVWYVLALSNATGYTPIAAQLGGDASRGKSAARFDECRGFERRIAYGSLNRLLLKMASEEQQDVRDRVIYILSSQGADGFRTLARIHDRSFGPFGEPADNRQALDARGRPSRPGAPSALALFTRNDVDAYLYNYLAVQTGDVGAFVMLKDFERSSADRAAYGQFVEQKAKRWTPYYEFYPPEAPDSGVPHSDESDPRGDVNEVALSRIDELPTSQVVEALTYLRVITRPPSETQTVYPGDVQTFQAMLSRPLTGYLAPIERVRAIQYAAVNGSPKAQLVLAVMYSEGVGVPRDYAKAYRWFAESEKQGNPEAKYAMSTFFSLGMSGVADQDRAKSVVYQIDSALAGFKPSVGRLQQVLAQVSRPDRRDPRDERFPR